MDPAPFLKWKENLSIIFQQEGGQKRAMNYHSMVERNREMSRQMADMAVQVIWGMAQRGEKIMVTELVRRTGFSRAFFYRNEYVRKEVEKAKEEQQANLRRQLLSPKKGTDVNNDLESGKAGDTNGNISSEETD